MPVNVVDVSAFTDPCVVPDNTEDATSASLLAMAQPLANRTKWLKDKVADPVIASGHGLLVEGGGNISVDSSGVVNVNAGAQLNCAPAASVRLPAPGGSTIPTATAFSRAIRGAPFYLDTFGYVASADGVFRLTQSSIAYFGIVGLRLNIPHGATLTGVTVYVKGAAGHGAMPATKASAVVVYANATADSGTPGNAVFSPQVTTAGYQAVHAISISGADLPTGVSPYDAALAHYDLYIVGETGANSVAGLKICGVTVDYTLSALDYGVTT
jgi:hypothetical protein